MARQTPEERGSEAAERARTDQGPESGPDRGPGAHSGAEQQPHDRAVPGTASSREGYQTRGGTAHDEPLAGVEAEDDRAAREQRDRAREAERDTTRPRRDDTS